MLSRLLVLPTFTVVAVALDDYKTICQFDGAVHIWLRFKASYFDEEKSIRHGVPSVTTDTFTVRLHPMMNTPLSTFHMNIPYGRVEVAFPTPQ